MKISSLCFLMGLMVFSCGPETTYKEPVDYVDPLLGTSSSRWMLFPGATMPFGMVKLSPDNVDEWKMDAGYEYTIESIMGFGHVHSWHMGSFITIPVTGPLKTKPGTKDDPDAGYRSRFKHDNEKASPGYYAVTLDDYNIRAELTTTTRCGFQRYTFPEKETPHVLFDLKVPQESRSDIVEAKIEKTGNREITGYARHSAGWNDYTLHFVARFDRDIKSMDGWQEDEVLKNISIVSVSGDKDIGVYLTFEASGNPVVLMQTGISYVSIEQARLNLDTEMKSFGWDFDAVHKAARDTWNNLLKKIEVAGGLKTDKVKFYTNLYRSYCARTIYSDVNGKYVDMCEKVQQLPDPDSPVYGSDAFWNTFWNLNQLWALITPDVTNKWVNSLLEIYDRGGWLAKGPAGIEYSSIMVASHEIPLIVGTWQKGIRNFDAKKALKAMREIQTTPGRPHECGGYVGNRNLRSYMAKGYVPEDRGQVSNTLEYAYDDWCVSQMALALNKKKDYEYFAKRAQFYRNVFDPRTKFVRPKYNSGAWVSPFTPVIKAHGKEDNFGNRNYIEGNAWQYTWFVPHDVAGLIGLMGKEEFNKRLDEGFENSRPDFVSEYVNHSNQPNMQAAWLFNYSGKPWLTQKWVRAILDHYYGTGPVDGYPGDEDQGQMGAWYVMAAMGLFEMDGGCSTEPVYELSGPVFRKITIHLDDNYFPGRQFVIEAKNALPENIYIQSAQLNGKPLDNFWFSHSELVKGGRLVLEMGPEPNKEWAAHSAMPPKAAPPTIVTTPYISMGDTYFLDSTSLTLNCDTEGVEIFYTLDGREPDRQSNLYEKPLELRQSAVLKMIAFKGNVESLVNTVSIKKAKLKGPVNPAGLRPGLSYHYFEGYFLGVHDLESAEAKGSGVVDDFSLEKREAETFFGFYFEGHIEVPADGMYKFTLTSNDGAVLWIGGQIAVNMDGLHPAQSRTEMIPLKKGFHPICFNISRKAVHMPSRWSGKGRG